MTASNLIKRWINVKCQGWTNAPWQSARNLLRLSARFLQTPARTSLKALMKSGWSCRAEPSRAESRSRQEESAKYYRAVTGCSEKSEFKCVTAKWDVCFPFSFCQMTPTQIFYVSVMTVNDMVPCFGKKTTISALYMKSKEPAKNTTLIYY